MLARASSDSLCPGVGSQGPTQSPNNDLRRASHDRLRQPSQDIPSSIESAQPTNDISLPPQQSAPHTPQDPSRPPDPARTPLTPLDTKYGSVRSILRDPNTPGTGQNVRFFSRDAFKVISPDVSVATSLDGDRSPGEISIAFVERMQPASSTPAARNRPSITEVFSHDGAINELEDTKTRMQPARPPDISEYFDMSQDHELPPIPLELDVPLLDTAMEVSMADEGSTPAIPASDVPTKNMTSTPYKPRSSEAPPQSEECSPSPDSNHSLSFGQTVFYSMANSLFGDSHKSSPSESKKPKSVRSSSAPTTRVHVENRNRASSDSMLPNIRAASHSPQPELDVDDQSSNVAVFSSPSPEPDPFRTDAATYYTPQTMIPATPPRGNSKHAKKNSREEDLILTLRTQLALQSELFTQYEVDLRARDELVEVLGKRVETAERDGEKRRNVLKGWKKKVAELEQVCRRLEEEIDLSRQESMERSVMDEASGEALRILHRQISGLESQKVDAKKVEAALRDEVGTLEGLLKERTEDVQRLKEALWSRDESENVLNAIRDPKDQMESMGRAVGVGGEFGTEQQDHYREAALRWEQERAELDAQIHQLRRENDDAKAHMDQQIRVREDELTMLKNELEAQWKYTETANEKIERLGKERDLLRRERDEVQASRKAFEDRIGDLEVEWTTSENRRNELVGEIQKLWGIKDGLEKERDEACLTFVNWIVADFISL